MFVVEAKGDGICLCDMHVKKKKTKNIYSYTNVKSLFFVWRLFKKPTLEIKKV